MNDIKKLIHINFMKEIPLKSTFSMILKKSILEGVFEILHPDPQLDQNFKPTGNLFGHFLYI